MWVCVWVWVCVCLCVCLCSQLPANLLAHGPDVRRHQSPLHKNYDVDGENSNVGIVGIHECIVSSAPCRVFDSYICGWRIAEPEETEKNTDTHRSFAELFNK